MVDAADFTVLTASLTILVIVVTLSATPFVLTTLWHRSKWFKCHADTPSFEVMFVTAKNAGTSWLITWGFYSAVSGAWMLSTCGFYGYTYGVVGMVVFSIAVGTEPIIAVILSRATYQHLTEANSLPESLRVKYGRVLELYTMVLMLLASQMSLAAEFIAVTATFNAVLGIDTRIILAILALFALYYIFIGGALVSLFTDPFHGIMSISCVMMLIYYLADLAAPYPPPPRPQLLWGKDRSATLLSFVGSIFFNITFGAFYEVLWQKHITSRNKPDLWTSAFSSWLLLSATAVFWGMPGCVLAWKEWNSGKQSGTGGFGGYMYLLALDPQVEGGTLRGVWQPYSFWFGVVVMVFVATSSLAAIEGWNNSLLSSFYGSMQANHRRLTSSRLLVVICNILALWMAHHQMNIMGVYAITNFTTATLAFPLFLSTCVPFFFHRSNQVDILASSLTGLLACAVYGMVRVADEGGMRGLQVLLQGLKLAFYSNNYEWQFCLLSLGVPLGVFLACISVKVWQGRSRIDGGDKQRGSPA